MVYLNYNTATMDDGMRKEVLGEVLMGELRTIHEYVQDIPEIKQTVRSIDARLIVVEDDMKAIKQVVKDHSKHLKRHDLEIEQLKQKIA